MAKRSSMVERVGVSSPAPKFKGLDFEYETSFFQFSPKSLVDSIYNIFYETIESRLLDFENSLIEECKDRVDDAVIKDKTGQFKANVIALLDESFPEFESFQHNHVFHIPNFVLMPEHKMFVDGNTTYPQQEEELMEEIRQLEARNMSLQFMNESMRSELDELKALKSVHAKALENISQIKAQLQQKIGRNDDKKKIIEELRKCLESSKLALGDLLESDQEPDSQD